MSAVFPTNSKLDSPLLSEVLFDQQAPSFSNLAPFSFNIEALESALLFSAGLINFVAIVGPSGWGKTHILSAIHSRFKNEGRACYPLVPATKLTGEGQFSASTPLLLDDCQELVEQGKRNALLRMTLGNRVRIQKPTILGFTSTKVTRSIRSVLPHPREWKICLIEEPNLTERLELIKHMARLDGLTLSPALVKILASEMLGNGRTIAGALKRLRLSGSQWNDNRAVVHACGILTPFFSDNSGWDLKHRIVRAVADQKKHSTDRSPFSDLAAYTMLHVACLSESDVARSLQVEPAEAYFSASRFEAELKTDTPKMVALAKLLETLVRVLAREG